MWNLDCGDITKVNVTTSTGIEPLSLFKEHISLISRLGHLNISDRILNNIKIQVIFLNPVYPKKKENTLENFAQQLLRQKLNKQKLLRRKGICSKNSAQRHSATCLALGKAKQVALCLCALFLY